MKCWKPISGNTLSNRVFPRSNLPGRAANPPFWGSNFSAKPSLCKKKYAHGKIISNAFQTNGTLLDDEWAVFLVGNQFLVGLSIDGPAKLHDAYRVDKKGEKRMPVTDWSVEPRQYGEFLCTIFDEWIKRDVGRTYVQLFDVTLGNTLGQGGGLCLFSETSGTALAMEHNGDIYFCDHYVYPQYKLGNILNHSLGEIVGSEAQRKFGQDKADSLPAYCRTCEVRHLCHGECPKHRFIRTPDGDPGLNCLGAAYKRFFNHTAPAMRQMGQLLNQGRAPAKIMGRN